jgi:guanyl-specific ribonuclease Sa
MNARLYDPVLGRFLSPDPYVQAPDFSQSFNSYSYCLNNPLMYVDEDGELFWLIPVVVGVISGVANLVSNWDNIDGFWQGVTTFAVGAGAGVAACYTGGMSFWAGAGIMAGTSALVGVNNDIVAQTGTNFSGIENVDWGHVGKSAASSAVGGFAGYAAGAWAVNGALSISGTNISSPMLRSLVVAPIASSAGHIAGGTTYGLLDGQSLSEAFNNSFEGLGTSIVMGTATSLTTTYAVSKASGMNPWTGKPIIDVSADDLGISTTMDRIEAGQSHPHKNDGSTFMNKEGVLPAKGQGYYKEYVHPTQGINGPGPQRIIIGNRGEYYYSPDHYRTFIRFRY